MGVDVEGIRANVAQSPVSSKILLGDTYPGVMIALKAELASETECFV